MRERPMIDIMPGHSWVLDPDKHSNLIALHGHTWLAVYYDPNQNPTSPTDTTLPTSFKGSFSMYYRASHLQKKHLYTPNLWRSQISTILSEECDLTDGVMYAAPSLDVSGANGMTKRDFEP